MPQKRLHLINSVRPLEQIYIRRQRDIYLVADVLIHVYVGTTRNHYAAIKDEK